MDKALAGAFVMLLLFICLTKGVEEMNPGGNRFYVKHVAENRANSHYHLVQTDGHSSAWIIAERGRYHVGDTLSFQLH
jgi:hypothetical protein